MHLLVLLLFVPFSAAENGSLCPHESTMVIEKTLVLSSDQYRGPPISFSSCLLTIQSSTGNELIVSITTSSSVSLRQPLSSNYLIIQDEKTVVIVKHEPKIYCLFSNILTVKMPLSLNYQAKITISPSIICDQQSFQCGSRCDFGATHNCSSVCIRKASVCDSLDNCGVDEADCERLVSKFKPTETSFRYQNILSSSQLMLVGFFVLNGSFIIFFLGLSICSVSSCFPRKLYKNKARASRMTFVKYLREASRQQPLLDRSPSPRPSRQERRPNILNRLNFEPSPILRELEPEVEDRTDLVPKDEICCLSAYQLYKRRQSLPLPRINQPGPPRWKRTSTIQ